MKHRDILAIVSTRPDDEAAIALAAQAAEQNDGFFSVLLVGWTPSVPIVIEGWAATPIWAQLVEEARQHLADTKSKTKTRLAGAERLQEVETAFLELGAAKKPLGLRARHADLCVVAQPKPGAEHAIFESALFESGRPVLVAPCQWTPRPIGRSVIVAWKPTREAARALADADSFVLEADRVSLVTIDAVPPYGRHGPHPGSDIAAHLARRGAKAQIANLASMGRNEAEVIAEHALAVDADLIVMGGYGRPRMSEFIFGGMTRDMLTASSVPVLMSH